MILSSAAPIVSVVMPIYNSENYLADSIESILGQTFSNWELICVDDGSTDGSLELLRRYTNADTRVRVISRPNTGVTRARNDGMALAQGKYIAVMDSDDVSLAERLLQQLTYMEAHPDCVALGAAVRVVGPDLLPINDEFKPLDHETIDRETMAGAGAAIRQPVAMFRTEAIRKVGGYREELYTHEETDLYLRLAEIGLLANLPDILLLYRLRLGSVNRTQRALQAQCEAILVRDARIRRGLPVGPEVADTKPASIASDDGRGSWALWSHYAFNGGYRSTARRYGWRAICSEPLAIASWKAMLRPYLRRASRRPEQ